MRVGLVSKPSWVGALPSKVSNRLHLLCGSERTSGYMEPSNLLRESSFSMNFPIKMADCFQQFLELFAAEFPDSLKLLHLAHASAHASTSLVWPDNVIPIF